MEDEYECTVPCDDTVAFESPDDLDINTGVLVVCESTEHSVDQKDDYCEKEVVLDSEDEGGSQNNAVNLSNGHFPVNGRPPGQDVTGLLRRRQMPAGCFRRLDNKVSKHVHLDSARSERSDAESTARRTSVYNDDRFQEQKPISSNPMNPDFLNPVSENLAEGKSSSHESIKRKDTNNDCKLAEFNYVESPQASESQDKALRFVDRFLSVSDLGSCKDIQTRMTNMTKSPPSMRSKGSQSLARRVNLGSSAGKLKTFDWAERQIVKDLYTSLRLDKDSIFEFEDDKSGCVFVNQESDDVNLHNKISNLKSEKLPGNISSLFDLNADSLNSNDSDNIGSNSGIRIAYDSMELDKQADAGLSMQNVEKVEQFRLMPDTLDVGLDTQVAAEAMEELLHAFPPRFDACSTLQGSDNTLLDNKRKSNHFANFEEAFVSWRSKRKRSKCMKISTAQDKSISWYVAKQFKDQRGTVVQSPVTEKSMNGEFLNSRNPRNTRNRKCRPIPGITVQQEEYGFTEQCRLKDFQKHHCLCGRRSKEINAGIKFDSSLRRRKNICFHEDLHTCLKSDFGSSPQVKADTEKREEDSNLNVADRNISKLNLWVYPKGKRAHQRTPRHSVSSSNECSPSVAIEHNVEKCPTVNEEAHNGVPKLLVYKRRRKFPLVRDQIGSSLELDVDLSSPVNDSAVSDKQASIGSDAGKSLMQYGILGDWKPSSRDASSNTKSNLSNEHFMTLQVLEDTDKIKQSLNPLSRSPLLTELKRLGYTGSLPDFLPKVSRRRRAMKKVCILFSQNLKKGTLKQQEKIVARLGLSIASSCSNATHFVADRFVRTRNMLEAIALGKPVVTHLWLESCEQAGCVINEKSFILRDEKKEKEIGFNLPVTLSRARKLPLLKGRRVLITPNVKPGIDVINTLVKAVQGEVVQTIWAANTKDKLVPDDFLIISCEEDYTICLQFLAKGASTYDSELLLRGILTQKLDYERYRLYEDLKENSHSSIR